MPRATLIAALNHVYLDGHFIGTLLCLGWLCVRRPRAFPVVRAVLLLSTGLALLIYLVFPLAPPRLMGIHLRLPQGHHLHHLVDTVAPLLPAQRQQAELGFNPYAAMPSVHFAWALIVGVTLVVMARHRVARVVGVIYPWLILVTGNHFVLDAAGAIVVVALATIATLLLPPRVTRVLASVPARGRLRPCAMGRRPGHSSPPHTTTASVTATPHPHAGG